MKLNVGDSVVVTVARQEVTVSVEDASKSDIIQGKVEAVSDPEKNQAAVFTYEVGKVYEFARKDIKAASG